MLGGRVLGAAAALAPVIALVASCGDNGTTPRAVDSGGPGPGTTGMPCGSSGDCRTGLVCKGGMCAPCGCSTNGTMCIVSDECAAGSYCGPMRTCAPGGMGANGASCQSDADCASGLRCTLVGFTAQCMPEGAGDVGAKCMTNADCLAGLGCIAGACTPYPPVPEGGPPLALPDWPGETCTDATGATQAYFRVPRGTGDGDFYRLPFPNDVRNDAGKVSLAGHPTPGSGLLGFDLVDRWLRDLEATVDGFSTSPSVYFRFSAGVDIGGTLKKNGAVRFLDITKPQMPVDLGFSWGATTDRNAYICNNWMAVRPPRGQPLTPGHTYAVILSTIVLDASLNPIQVSPDLTALLGATASADATLAAQWPKYKPLRDWAAATGTSVGSILNAAVFTVGHPSAIGAPLAAAVAAATPAPTATGWIRCGAAPSPCPQATGARACGTPDPTFDELHALVTLPIFQKGNEPYATPADGGGFVLDGSGTPQVQRTEQVCLGLTVPKGVTMPAGGWPLVVYAHGTGGSFRSHVAEGVAARLASVDDGAGGHVNIAVLGIDQVEHGTRRGTSQESPDNLFYNFVNPLAARGNTLQGAADQLSLLRFAASFDLPAAQSPTNAEIKFGSLAFWGHSQGASEGALAVPYAAGAPGGFRGVVLSGEGASLMDALLTKKNPVDIADAIPVVLEDPKVDGNHPVLSLLQGDLGVVDPLNYGAMFFASPVAPANAKHVLQPYGQNDTYSPPVTQLTFAAVTQLSEAAPPSGVTGPPLFGTNPLAVPPGGVGGNAMVGGMPFTAIVRQYSPASTYDGHFVAFDNAAAEADVDHFLADALAGKVPHVGR